MTDLPRLPPHQCAIVLHWLPDAELIADLSWELMGTAFLDGYGSDPHSA